MYPGCNQRIIFNWLIICYLAPIARTKRFAWKDRWIRQRVFLCRYLLQEAIFNQTSRVLVATPPFGFHSQIAQMMHSDGGNFSTCHSKSIECWPDFCVPAVTPAVWNPTEFFKKRRRQLRHSAGSRSELFAQPLCWNQGLAWPWDYHGTFVFLDLREWLICMANVGKYASPMDPMELKHTFSNIQQIDRKKDTSW